MNKIITKLSLIFPLLVLGASFFFFCVANPFENVIYTFLAFFVLLAGFYLYFAQIRSIKTSDLSFLNYTFSYNLVLTLNCFVGVFGVNFDNMPLALFVIMFCTTFFLQVCCQNFVYLKKNFPFPPYKLDLKAHLQLLGDTFKNLGFLGLIICLALSFLWIFTKCAIFSIVIAEGNKLYFFFILISSILSLFSLFIFIFKSFLKRLLKKAFEKAFEKLRSFLKQPKLGFKVSIKQFFWINFSTKKVICFFRKNPATKKNILILYIAFMTLVSSNLLFLLPFFFWSLNHDQGLLFYLYFFVGFLTNYYVSIYVVYNFFLDKYGKDSLRLLGWNTLGEQWIAASVRVAKAYVFYKTVQVGASVVGSAAEEFEKTAKHGISTAGDVSRHKITVKGEAAKAEISSRFYDPKNK